MPGRGEAPRRDVQEVEAVTATAEPESPASTEHLMEAICAPDNIETALRAVVRNQGAPGVDGITVKRLPGILKARWSEIEDQLLRGRYQPQPVRRVKIPKPAGGVRNLGIPTVIDRVIQQAVLQRLQPRWDPTFSEHSYGFRPGRSAHQAVVQAQAYVIDGYRFVVDIVGSSRVLQVEVFQLHLSRPARWPPQLHRSPTLRIHPKTPPPAWTLTTTTLMTVARIGSGSFP